MSNMLKITVYTFVLMLALTVCAFAQVTKLPQAQGTVIQNQQATTQKPTPTPAASNAQFIVAPGSGEAQFDVPAQKLTVRLPEVTTGGGTGSAASELEQKLRSELKGFASQAEKTTGAVKTLNNEVNGLHNELEAEKSARAQGDQNLQTQVDTVKADVGSLTSSLQLEADNRKAEDAKLNTRVTKIEKEGSYGSIALWLAILALVGVVAVVIWVSKRKPATIIQHQPPNHNQAGGSGGTPVNNPPSGDGSDPAKPLKLGTTKPETLTTSADDLKAPKADQLDFARKLTDEESRWFERAQNIWAEYREEGREGNFQRSNLKKRIIDPSKFEALKGAIEREEARIARNVKPAQERPVFKRQPAQADEKPADTQPANEAEANNGDFKTIANPSPNAQAKSATSGTDA